MPDVKTSRGMIAVDKIGTKVLFLNPVSFETEVVLDGFPRTVHELLVVPETSLAYVPIFGDGIHGRNPNPGHLLCIIDLEKRAHVGDIDLSTYKMVDAIDSGSTNGHRMMISLFNDTATTENEEDGTVSVIDLP